MEGIRQEVRQCISEVASYAEGKDYAGYDPYDALNSPVVRCIGRMSKCLRLGMTQLLRRSPVNLRPLLGIRKEHNPKGIGLFLWGYVKLYALEDDACYLERIDHLLDLLEKSSSKGYSGRCWGYNFDWQSRTAMRPKGTPTVVNTSFIGHALLDCFQVTGNRRALEMAVPIAEFILNDLHRTRLGERFCFSYTPVDREVVHNANLLGASILARLNKYCNDERLSDAVLASLSYSMRHQRSDGSWFYADTEIQRWIDSFHTGFNLQAIRYILNEGLGREYRHAYRRGVAYYADNFFLKDGTPGYYHDKIYPIDIHSPAQAICFFSLEGAEYGDLTDKLVTWMLRNMYGGKGVFYFRRGRLWANRICYMRWAQAWAFHALSEYLYSLSERSRNGGERGAIRAERTRCSGDLLPFV